jgi:hypothetical protein
VIPLVIVEAKCDVRVTTVILLARLSRYIAYINDGESAETFELWMCLIHIVLKLLKVLNRKLDVGRESIDLCVG